MSIINVSKHVLFIFRGNVNNSDECSKHNFTVDDITMSLCVFPLFFFLLFSDVDNILAAIRNHEL
jgi:hypothetical protein